MLIATTYYVGELLLCFFFFGVKFGLGFLARKLEDVDEKKDPSWNTYLLPPRVKLSRIDRQKKNGAKRQITSC
jgi:hypothetical protein